MQHLADKEAGIKPDEVGKCERAHWNVGAKFHGLVNGFRGADTLLEGQDRLVYVRNQDSVGDKPGHVLKVFLSHSVEKRLPIWLL